MISGGTSLISYQNCIRPRFNSLPMTLPLHKTLIYINIKALCIFLYTLVYKMCKLACLVMISFLALHEQNLADIFEFQHAASLASSTACEQRILIQSCAMVSGL